MMLEDDMMQHRPHRVSRHDVILGPAELHSATKDGAAHQPHDMQKNSAVASLSGSSTTLSRPHQDHDNVRRHDSNRTPQKHLGHMDSMAKHTLQGLKSGVWRLPGQIDALEEVVCSYDDDIMDSQVVEGGDSDEDAVASMH
jgi:hypothetical protein